MSKQTPTPDGATATPAKKPIHVTFSALGRLLRCSWSRDGWTVTQSGSLHRFHYWFFAGTCRSEDGLVILEIVIGPVKVSIG